MNSRKIIPVSLMLAVVGAALAACMNNDAANTQPAPTANYEPNATMGTQNGNGAAGMTQNGASNMNGASNGAANNGNTAAAT